MGQLIPFTPRPNPRAELADFLEEAAGTDPLTAEYVEILRDGDEIDEIEFLERQLAEEAT